MFENVNEKSTFQRTVAPLTGRISLLLKEECECYGMTEVMYKSLMNFSKISRKKFNSLISAGNFYFEGRNSYNTKQLVITVSDGANRVGSHIPEEFLPKINDEEEEEVGEKRKLMRGERGPGKKQYIGSKAVNQISKTITDKLVSTLDELLTNYPIIKRNQIIESSIKNLRKVYNINEENERSNSELNDKIVIALKQYLLGLKLFGGKYSQVEATIESLLSAVSVDECSNVEIGELLQISRRRIAAAKQKRKMFDDIVEKEKKKKERSIEIIDSDGSVTDDNSVVDEYSADFGDYNSDASKSDNENENNVRCEISDRQTPEAKDTEKENVFLFALSPRERLLRRDKLKLGVVRDYCHEVCRLDTFASAKVFVHDYDGNHSYHQVHQKTHALQEYYNMFSISPEYYAWQNENKRLKKKKRKSDPDEYIIPTIKLRSFTNAFCPCCINQKQRDCANHIQVNLTNALKALGVLRRCQAVSRTMRTCGCTGHNNQSYLQCHTSLNSFIDAMLCPKQEYPTLSAQINPSASMEHQEEMNIRAKAVKIKSGEEKLNRNIKREGAARQTKSIPLLNWGPVFSCHLKECAYQKCAQCGIKNFFKTENLCNAERNVDCVVTVRKYENVPGRSRGMQMEIVEVKMNGDELLEHLIHCATLAIPHEWNIKWNAHARTICVNTSKADVLTLMTDFSAVLDHDVQDRLNTAIPCRSNQCIFLATHSPRIVELQNEVQKRVQENDVWHFWSAQGGALDTNAHYHSVCTRHILDEYSFLNLRRVNIFTDGCGEQYKSRRAAYFVGALAEERNMVVTHNYAPTASFKTMVDGQGNVTKAFYRKLERSEEEGTRCPTTYDLFKLFTSKYPLTPDFVDDVNRNPMTVTRRHHRFLVDKSNATPEMMMRAETQKDVIITDIITERWDAPPLNGIKSVFSLIAAAVDGKVRLFSRPHTCFCSNCMRGEFTECLHAAISGNLKEEKLQKLPFKETVARKNCLSEVLQRVNFFKGVIHADGDENIIIAIPCMRTDSNDDPFVLGLMTKKIKETKEDLEVEHLIDGNVQKTTIKKGTWCITFKYLYCKNALENEYYIPVKSKEIKISVLDVYYPADQSDVTRNNYLTCLVQRSVLDSQVSVVYILDSDKLDELRSSMMTEM